MSLVTVVEKSFGTAYAFELCCFALMRLRVQPTWTQVVHVVLQSRTGCCSEKECPLLQNRVGRM